MAAATSLPEFFVSVLSAFYKKPELSFGNIIGSNIIILTLMMAIAAFLAKGLMGKINHVVVKQERRRKRRFVLDSPIAITFDTEQGITIEGVLIDIEDNSQRQRGGRRELLCLEGIGRPRECPYEVRQAMRNGRG